MKKMKRILLCMLALVLASGFAQAAFADDSLPFTDVPAGSYYHDAVGWAVANGITVGTSAHTFSPNLSATRAQVVTFLWRQAGSPEPAAEATGNGQEARGGETDETSVQNPFTDVHEDDYFCKAVLWAVETGVTKGMSETKFEPSHICTREQVVTFLWRVAGEPAPEGENRFDDVHEASYAYRAILWATKLGVAKGITVTEFRPKSQCTRAQIVTFLHRAAEPPQTQEQLLTVPQIRIVTENGNGVDLQKADDYVSAEIKIIDLYGNVMKEPIQLKVRGNSTAMESVQKKAYNFKFDKKKDVLGLGKGKKWSLLANTFDPTLLRNALANTIARELALDYVSNRSFVELWLDGVYRGCYELYVPVQAKPERVDIDVESNGGKKDFLLEYEKTREDEDVTYISVSGLRFGIEAPEEPTEAQVQYITETMQGIVNTLKTGSREEIEAVLDVESFARFGLLNEYMKTLDFDMSSVFFYYKDGKLCAGPPWDFDLSTGNVNADLSASRCKEAASPEGLYAMHRNLYQYLSNKPWFIEEVAAVYREHAAFFADISKDGGLLDTMRKTYQAVLARNFAPDCWDVSKWWVNYQKKPLPGYAENYQYLKDWCAARNAWLQATFGA